MKEILPAAAREKKLMTTLFLLSTTSLLLGRCASLRHAVDILHAGCSRSYSEILHIFCATCW